MSEDDLVREVRAAREEYCRQFGYDLGAIVHDLREQERTGGREVVRLPPRMNVVPREYAGKWLAWSEDGHQIIAVADSFKAAEQAAVSAGFPADRIAIDRAPTARQRLTGSGM